ncbi:glutathione S-transferase N-terminal domain-containing protein [Pseudoroseomonas globiformis]|uniref:Glutathione S-transferase N-terminal domain-containing protein n=1 Tax=Teichococcus globiformis TaxID=2307229 RepID=A0ABV7FXF5_9PROT
MRLYGYAHSSATERVRLALALKGLDAPVLLSDASDRRVRDDAEPRLNELGGAPVLQLADGTVLTQSLAITEWLEELWPTPPLLPPDPLSRARIRAFVMTVLCDVQPMHDERAFGRLCDASPMEGESQSRVRGAIANGLAAGEAMLCDSGGPFCFSDVPGLADLCLVPQLALARRFGVHLAFPRLLAAEAACLTLPAFRQVYPETIHAD